MKTNHTPVTFDLFKTLGEAFDPRKISEPQDKLKKPDNHKNKK